MAIKPFKKGDNLLGIGFRQKLNHIAETAEKNRPQRAGQGSQRTTVNNSTVNDPYTLIALMQVKSGESWAAGTTDGITDDVNSVTCQMVLWVNTDDGTNPNEYAETGTEPKVYNSIGTTEPSAGSKLLAVFNRQSGRWELLV